MYHTDELPNGRLHFHTVGVMDGHDSDVASDLVSKCLPLEVSRLLKEGYLVVEAYKKAMEILEDKLKQVTATAGTCVLSCTLAGRFIWCANLGDCRAMLISLVVPDNLDVGPEGPRQKPRIDRIVWLSKDHKASLERERIANLGGRVVDGRVGGLEPSRTLGDFDVKNSVNPDVISIVPEIKRHELGNGTEISQALIVCATDGIWDLLTGADICNLVSARNQIVDLQSAMAASTETSRTSIDRSVLRTLAEDFVQFSVAKGSRDDCTAIVTFISVPPCGVEPKAI
jgi:serine/threonine protein phosphatase PrpC